jgi:hypothetical protein
MLAESLERTGIRTSWYLLCLLCPISIGVVLDLISEPTEELLEDLIMFQSEINNILTESDTYDGSLTDSYERTLVKEVGDNPRIFVAHSLHSPASWVVLRELAVRRAGVGHLKMEKIEVENTTVRKSERDLMSGLVPLDRAFLARGLAAIGGHAKYLCNLTFQVDRSQHDT